MMNYDPNVDSLIGDMPVEEKPREILPEKKIDESQTMADFSTPIEEVLQNEVMGGVGPTQGGPSASRMQYQQQQSQSQEKDRRVPFGLSEDQFQALLAGAAAVVAFSKPVQSRLTSMVPNSLGDSGLSTTGLVATALIAAIVFYFLQKFILERT